MKKKTKVIISAVAAVMFVIVIIVGAVVWSNQTEELVLDPVSKPLAAFSQEVHEGMSDKWQVNEKLRCTSIIFGLDEKGNIVDNGFSRMEFWDETTQDSYELIYSINENGESKARVLLREQDVDIASLENPDAEQIRLFMQNVDISGLVIGHDEGDEEFDYIMLRYDGSIKANFEVPDFDCEVPTYYVANGEIRQISNTAEAETDYAIVNVHKMRDGVGVGTMVQFLVANSDIK